MTTALVEVSLPLLLVIVVARRMPFMEAAVVAAITAAVVAAVTAAVVAAFGRVVKFC